MNRKRDLEKLGQVYASAASPQNYYLFLTFRHSRDNAGPNEFRLRKESELTSKDRNQFKHMKEYSSSMNDTHPDAKTYSDSLGTFPFRICVEGPEKTLKQLLGDFIKNFNGELYPEKEIMKRKTEEIFGDIIYNESVDGDIYILFVKWLSEDKLVGSLRQKHKLTKEEKKLFSLMNPYNTHHDRKVKSYELKAPLGSFNSQMAFVGPEKYIKGYVKSYKNSYGDQFSMEVPMKDETKKHFKDII
jgi:hypothetical protein